MVSLNGVGVKLPKAINKSVEVYKIIWNFWDAYQMLLWTLHEHTANAWEPAEHHSLHDHFTRLLLWWEYEELRMCVSFINAKLDVLVCCLPRRIHWFLFSCTLHLCRSGCILLKCGRNCAHIRCGFALLAEFFLCSETLVLPTSLEAEKTDRI